MRAGSAWILFTEAGEGDINILTPDPRSENKKAFKGSGGGGVGGGVEMLAVEGKAHTVIGPGGHAALTTSPG